MKFSTKVSAFALVVFLIFMFGIPTSGFTQALYIHDNAWTFTDTVEIEAGTITQVQIYAKDFKTVTDETPPQTYDVSLGFSDKLEYSVLTNIMEFSLDGKYTLFKGAIGVGAKYNDEDWFLEPGLYVSVVVTENGTTLSPIFHIDVFKGKLGGGFGFHLWKTPGGIVTKPVKGDLFITLNYQILEL